MGCKASKAVDVVVVPMPEKVKQNLDSNNKLKEREDSLRGSRTSLSSSSETSRSDRETSAKSTRTTDSGLGELEDETIVTERSDQKIIQQTNAEERPPTPGERTDDLSIDGTKVPRRKSPKERKVSFSQQQESVRNRVNSLAPLGGVLERPQSRGGMAFHVMLCPETGNVKRKPQHLKKLDKRRKKSKRRTREEIEEKMIQAQERRKEHEQQLIEKALSSRKERQLKEAKALDEFAKRQMDQLEMSS